MAKDTGTESGLIIRSFPPVSDPSAQILILGSMPGKASLDANQYYAHPRNLFWRIMGEIIGAGQGMPYDVRLLKLQQNRIALWDVLQSCSRTSSLDSDIRNGKPNDIAEFLNKHPSIYTICFNGKKAEQSFRKYRKTLDESGDIGLNRKLLYLPSTSPANASVTYEKKLSAWKQALKA